MANRTIEDTVQFFERLAEIIDDEDDRVIVQSTLSYIRYLILGSAFPIIVIPTKNRLGRASINEAIWKKSALYWTQQ